MLNNTLNTNEIKNAAGTGVAFERVGISGTTTTFKQVGMPSGLPYIMKIGHATSGVDTKAFRRSVIRFEKTSENSDGAKVPSFAQVTLGHPEGLADDYNDAKALLANLMSFLSTTGAGTTVLFDGSGNGAKVLLDATL